MTDIAPAYKGAAVESVKPSYGVPDAPRQPWGKQISTVQPHPTPLIVSPPTPGPMAQETDKLMHLAQAKADITGTGTIVDVTV